MELRGETVPTCGPDEGCITCGDEATPMRVLEVDAVSGLALCVAEDGIPSDVEVGLVDTVGPGDEILVHAGVALTRLEGPLSTEREAMAAGQGAVAG